MPTVAAIVDQFKPWMGRVVYASEAGHVIDRREPVSPESVFQIPEGYAPMREVKTKEKR